MDIGTPTPTEKTERQIRRGSLGVESSAPSPTHRRAYSDAPSRSGSPPPRPSLADIGVDPNDLNAAFRQAHETTSPTRYSTDSPFPPLSPGATDRVFPIRSVVSVDSNPTPMRSETSGYGFPNVGTPSEPESLAKGQQSLRHPSNTSGFTSNTSVGSNGGDRDVFSESPSRTRRVTVDTQQYRSAQSTPRRNTGRESRNEIDAASSEPTRMGGQRQMTILSDSASMKLNESFGSGNVWQAQKTATESLRSGDGDANGYITARFKHVMTDGGHAVITGRDGDTLQRCEDEPIHIPGAIQGFGLLIAFSEESEGMLVVRVVSENSKDIIGYSPRELFALNNFCDILSDEQAENLLDQLDFIRDEECDTAANGPEVFTLSIRPPKRRALKLWCAMHINPTNPDLIICEFELEDDTINPLVPPDESTPEPPEDTLNSNPTAEELAESTINSSKPLRVLRSARKRKGEAAAMEVFNIMSQVQEQLANAPDLDKFLKILVGVVKELTGFHRVMVYQFDAAWNGRVVTELVDPRATKDLYKGLNFPASDIPKQARDLYKINKVRLLYDRDQITARLVCRTLQDLERPLDLTYSYLRAMSPIHIKYLANMAVRASMSISINAFDELWGLISLHAYGAKGMRVSFPIRKMCRLVGDSASRNIERLSYASRLHARKLINTVPTEKNPSGYIVASSDDLLKLFNADAGLLSIRDETKVLGKVTQMQEALALLEYLRLRCFRSVMTSQDVRIDFPDLRYAPGFSVIAGLLLVPLTVSGKDFIVFFRKGHLREVKWAGNPYEKFIKEGTEGYLEPRKSFKVWSETIVGQCKPWTEEEIETAAVLCLVYGKFIEVWRQKEQALQNSQLTKLLLANSAHEVRTPLNAIINYLEIAMEGSLDHEMRENLSKSHSASKSLIYVINDLLDLTKTEEGHNLIKDDAFDLAATVQEAVDMFRGDAKRKQINCENVEHPGVPRFVMGDQRRVRQAISNIVANAIQHTTTGGVKVELWLLEKLENRAEVEIAIQDTGAGMSASQLDALFRELEQVQYEADDTLSEDMQLESKQLTQGGQEKRALGLGLAVVARIVRILNGQLRLKSEEGKGSRFVIQLGFDLPQKVEKQSLLADATAAGVGPPSNQPATPPITQGEVTLVNKSAQKPTTSTRETVIRGNSRESVSSLKSTKSATSLNSFKSANSQKSDVDRMIDALTEPHMISSPTHESRTRSASHTGRKERILESGQNTASLQKSHTVGSGPTDEQSSLDLKPLEQVPGETNVIDSKTPIRPVRVQDGDLQGNAAVQHKGRSPGRVLFDLPDQKAGGPTSSKFMRVLVAEDDPINSKIMKKRLEKLNHEVHLTVNGEECAHVYAEKTAAFDVVLMDMQVSSFLGKNMLHHSLIVTRCLSLMALLLPK